MKRMIFKMFLMVVSILVIFVFVFTGCKTTAEEVSTAEKTVEGVTEEATIEESSKETTVEEETDEVVEEGMYALYETYKKAAKAGEQFPGNPGEGKKIAFANLSASFAYCLSVQNSIIEVLKLAGFSDEDVTILDNQLDASIGLQNADIVLAKNVDGFMEFQVDAKINSVIGKKFSDAEIPILAIDIPIPGASYMGVDNYQAAYLTGEWLIEEIDKRFGSIDNVDLIIMGMVTTAGDLGMLRHIGVQDAFLDKYGEEINEKIVMEDMGNSAEPSEKMVAAVLASNPDAKNIVIACSNDPSAKGAIAAVNSIGTLERENIIYVSQGLDESGIAMLRNGEIDGDIAYFPENYGWYAVPGIVALMQGKPIPPYMYVDNGVVTIDNVDEYYPEN